jgi:Tol biopolymer transport system component
LVWVDRDGRQEPIPAPGSWFYPRLSPDGNRVAADHFRSASRPDRDIYIWDLERETLSRLTDDPSEDLIPYWSADGSRVFFSSNRGGAAFNLYMRSADGTGEDVLIFESDESIFVKSLTPDGRQLLANRAGDIVVIDVEAPRRSRVLATPASDVQPSISPDGRWVAYESDVEGRTEVYVGPYPDLGSRKWKISSGGGQHPFWSRSGDEIFFRGPTGSMMAAQVTLEPTFAPGKITELFPNSKEEPLAIGGGRGYDVSPFDGRFLMVRSGKAPAARLVVVLNWFQELRAKVPVD